VPPAPQGHVAPVEQLVLRGQVRQAMRNRFAEGAVDELHPPIGQPFVGSNARPARWLSTRGRRGTSSSQASSLSVARGFLDVPIVLTRADVALPRIRVRKKRL